MNLVEQITSQLGVSTEQASGGAGLIFKLLKERLDPEQFGQVEESVPEASQLADAAPAAGDSGGVGGLLGKALGGVGLGNLGALGSLVGGFKSLGLDADKVMAFAKSIFGFVESKGGAGIKDVIEKALTKG